MSKTKLLSNVNDDEFVRAYGYAMWAWQSVEVQLFQLFYVLVNAKSDDIVAAIYYSIESLEMRLRVLGSVLSAFVAANSDVDQAVEMRWLKLSSEVTRLSMHRNILAHWEPTLAIGENGKTEFVLDQHFRQPIHSRRRKVSTYDAGRIGAMAAEFESLASLVAQFADELSPFIEVRIA